MLHQSQSQKPDVEQPAERKSGTRNYFAPEVSKDLAFSKKSDVFALGGTLFAMLAKRDPFHGLSKDQITEALRQDKRPDIPSEWPAGYVNIIRKCWLFNPSDRPTARQVEEVFDDMISKAAP